MMDEINMDKKFKIIVDSREPIKIVNLLENEGIKVEIKSIDVGDYIISETLAIERKEGRDLVSSITQDKRNLFEQLIRLSDTYENPILLIENLKSAFKSQMKPSSIYGVLTSIAQKHRIPIVPTLNYKDTVIALKRMVIREQKEEEDLFIIARTAPKGMTHEERQRYYLEGLYKIGPKKATQLLEVFSTPDGVHKAIKNTKLLYTKTGNIKGIEGALCQVKGIGPNFVIKNKKLLFNIEEDKEPSSQTKLMAKQNKEITKKRPKQRNKVS
ncbi:MAG: ERCC4 domain-containing protein [Candidatus Helarchaeota archaeon]